MGRISFAQKVFFIKKPSLSLELPANRIASLLLLGRSPKADWMGNKVSRNRDEKQETRKEAMLAAAKDGRLHHVKKFIRWSKVDVNAVSANGQTALIRAAQQGHLDVVRWLLKRGANVDAVEEDQWTALMFAVKYEREPVVRLLLDQDANVNRIQKNKWTPLMLAALIGNVGIATLLLDRGAAIDAVQEYLFTALMISAANGGAEVAKLLLDRNANINVVNNCGRTCLSVAAGKGHLDLVYLLLNANADVDTLDQDGNTALTRSALKGHSPVVEILLYHGANPTITNREGMTALIYATKLNHHDVVEMLKAAAPLQLEDEVKPKPLPDAAAINSSEIFLDQVRQLCRTMNEAQAMCQCLYIRFRQIHDQIGKANDVQAISTAYSTLLQRFHSFLVQFGNKRLITRIVSGRIISSVCQELHTELSTLTNLCGADSDELSFPWKEKLISDASAHGELLQSAFENKQQWKNEVMDPEAQAEALTLLMFELDQRTGKHDARELQLIERICQSVARFSKLAIPSIPGWFLPPHEVQFNVEASFGCGTYGSVHIGSWMGTKVAVKSAFLENNESRRMFLHEADIWSSLQHPHIIKLYGACHVGNPFFVCEYASKGTLRDYLLLEENQHQTWKSLHEAALGLCYLHTKKNVVHRDLKCDNILIGQDGLAKLADFGLSCREADLPPASAVSDIGAIQWKAPECISGESSGSTTADVYSFGMTIIQAVARTLPWGLIADATVKSKVVTLHELPNQPVAFSDSQWKFVTRMCTANPSDRINMTTAVKELKAFAQEELENYWSIDWERHQREQEQTQDS